ncbi:MAG: glutathione S-transferase [Polyangiales bacterium]
MATGTPELYYLPYSPWSIKARWALDHHRLPYKKHVHLPMVGEAKLRIKAGTLFSAATVPLLITNGDRFKDSWTIARYADEIGEEQTLFPERYLDDIESWNRLSEEALCCGRVRVVERGLRNDQALIEQLPWRIPSFMNPIGRWTSKTATKFLAGKYETPADPEALEHALELVSSTLKKNGTDTLLPTFSYADIAMAVLLQMVDPVDHPTVRLTKAVRENWCDANAAAKFPELIAWRNRLYERYPTK